MSANSLKHGQLKIACYSKILIKRFMMSTSYSEHPAYRFGSTHPSQEHGNQQEDPSRKDHSQFQYRLITLPQPGTSNKNENENQQASADACLNGNFILYYLSR